MFTLDRLKLESLLVQSLYFYATFLDDSLLVTPLNCTIFHWLDTLTPHFIWPFINKLSKINLSCPLTNHLSVGRSTLQHPDAIFISAAWVRKMLVCLFYYWWVHYFALTSECAAFPISSLWCLIDFTTETVTHEGEMQMKDKRDTLDFHYVPQRRVCQVCAHFKTSGYKKNKKQIPEFSSL